MSVKLAVLIDPLSFKPTFCAVLFPAELDMSVCLLLFERPATLFVGAQAVLKKIKVIKNSAIPKKRVRILPFPLSLTTVSQKHSSSRQTSRSPNIQHPRTYTHVTVWSDFTPAGFPQIGDLYASSMGRGRERKGLRVQVRDIRLILDNPADERFCHPDYAIHFAM
jgi:hypothetical protein